MKALIPKQPNTAIAGGRNSYYRDIDILRAVAVLAVFANHLNSKFIPFGYLGVDMFFVISGFVITLSLDRAIAKKQSFATLVRTFYAKRIKRIFPALLVFTIVTGLSISLFDPWNQFSLRTGISGIFGFSNLYLLRYSLDYFKPLGEVNPFLNTWSLGVEEQYYLIYPILLLASGAFVRNDKLGVWRKRLFVFLVILGMLSLALNIGLANTSTGTWAYYLMPSRFWEIAIGCLCALAGFKTNLSPASRIQKLLIYNALVLSIIILFFARPSWFPGTYQLIPVITLCILTSVILSLIQSQDNLLALQLKPLLFIGLTSYSLYLWHWSVIVIFRFTLGVTKYTIFPIIVVTLIISLTSYYFVELPFRYGLLVDGSKRKVLGFIAACASVVGALLVIEQAPTGSRTNPLYVGKLYSNYDHLSQDPSSYKGEISGRTSQMCNIISKDRFEVNKTVRDCTFRASSNKAILFIGDSHAMTLLPLAEKLSIEKQITTTVISGSCAFPPDLLICDQDSHESANSAYEAFLRNNSHLEDKIVISTSFFPLRFLPIEARVPGHDLRGMKSDTEAGFSAFKKSLMDISTRFGQDSIRFAILIHPPVFHEFRNPSLCAPQWFRKKLGHVCSRASMKDLVGERSFISDSLKSLVGVVPRLTVLDSIDAICGAPARAVSYCSPQQGGQILYHDFNHLNRQGALLLESMLKDMVDY